MVHWGKVSAGKFLSSALWGHCGGIADWGMCACQGRGDTCCSPMAGPIQRARLHMLTRKDTDSASARVLPPLIDTSTLPSTAHPPWRPSYAGHGPPAYAHPQGHRQRPAGAHHTTKSSAHPVAPLLCWPWPTRHAHPQGHGQRPARARHTAHQVPAVLRQQALAGGGQGGGGHGKGGGHAAALAAPLLAAPLLAAQLGGCLQVSSAQLPGGDSLAARAASSASTPCSGSST